MEAREQRIRDREERIEDKDMATEQDSGQRTGWKTEQSIENTE